MWTFVVHLSCRSLLQRCASELLTLGASNMGTQVTEKANIRIPHAIKAASAQGRISLDDWGWRNPLTHLSLHNSVSEPQAPFNCLSQA